MSYLWHRGVTKNGLQFYIRGDVSLETFLKEGGEETVRLFLDSVKQERLDKWVSLKVGQNIAFSYLEPELIYIKEEFRGLGIGSALIEFLKEAAERFKIDMILVSTLVSSDRAKRLFAKKGFSLNEENHTGYFVVGRP